MTDILTESEMAGIFESVTEISSANPYKIRVDFDHRFHVWKNEILPGRMNSIRREHSIEYIYRTMDLLIADASRLTDRVIHEGHGPELICTIEEIDTVMKNEISAYITELDNIKLEGVK